MRHALSQESWKALLSASYHWLEKVTLSGATATVAGAHHVVAVKVDPNDKDRFLVDASALPEATRTKLADAAKALGWRTSAGPLHLSVGDLGFTLVSVASTKVGSCQLARQLGLDAAKATKDLALTHVAFCAVANLSALDVFEGYAAGLYGTVGFKGTRKNGVEKMPTHVSLAGSTVTSAQISEVLELAKSQAVTRFLQDAPANYLTPVKFAEIAQDVAQDVGIRCKVLDKEQMTALGMGMFLSVSDGSVNEPRTIVLEIDGKDNSRTVALVGKGLTFDSGGISIKPSAGMEEMKYDMSGGAAVLGAAYFLGKVKPPVKVVCIIGATENMPSGSATKPGDVARAMNGKTVEIHNTDAEGRLVLGDCLHYAISEFKPALVVDIATLTGAVLMALGCVGSAVLSNDQDTVRRVLSAGEKVGEPLWQLPLWPELEKEVKGEIADLKNIAKSSVKGGTIMGGMFLKEFVGETPWAHLDIAGTGWNCQATGYPSSGGSAAGLRTLVAVCQSFE